MATPTISTQRLTLLPTPFDAKRCNYYVDGSNIVIETIAEYLVRVSSTIRDTPLISILYPKEGYTSLGTYPIGDFNTILANFDSLFYSFVGGVLDVNFVQVLQPRNYGEMYEYENTNITTIGTQNIYHAVNHFITGLTNGFTFTAGIEGTGSISNYSGTVAGTVLLLDTAHGLNTGDIITVHSSTDYNGTKSIIKVTDDAFYFTATYTSNQSADWAMGSYLKCSAGSDGIYNVMMNNTSFASSVGKTFKFELNKNTIPLDNIAVSRKYASIDYTSLAASGLVSLVTGDRIWLSCRNETDATEITVRHCNVHLIRV